MKQQFIETIKIKNGKALALPYHQARMERTIRRFFPTLASEEIKLSSLISPKEEMNLYKARVFMAPRAWKPSSTPPTR
mgnify:CR=1 FL=1